MEYILHPKVKKINYTANICKLGVMKHPKSNVENTNIFAVLNKELHPSSEERPGNFCYYIGEKAAQSAAIMPQGYELIITQSGITVNASDLLGMRYGVDTLAQIISQAQNGEITCLSILDYPLVANRGLMLDVSRGKVYTKEYLLSLVDLLAKFRYNVFQLYIEHTFDFKTHPEICKNSDPITAQDILDIQEKCKQNGIELQANLQSLGHCNRILTREEHNHLAESDMFWSLCTTSDDALQLLDELYGEYLPLFESEWLNVCMDEPYDIGKGQSACKNIPKEELYAAFLLNVSKLAAKYGKKIMAFGDFVCRHKDYLSKMPEDLIYLDWCYDPKEHYGTPQIFKGFNLPFWVCPGSGNWNTLFPRFGGALTNVVNLITEGIQSNTQGMLFTDWNDHGGYTQPAPGYYLYALASATAWSGEEPAENVLDKYADKIIGINGYSKTIKLLAQIYELPPIWSKNRSQCVMALFDEPIFGKAVRGEAPPAELKAFDVSLPAGVEPVLERHSQHPLRPYFSVPNETCRLINAICQEAVQQINTWEKGCIKSQLLYIVDAFLLITDKLKLSKKIIEDFDTGKVDTLTLIKHEDSIRAIIARYVRLQILYIDIWKEIAKTSEIEISITYFAHIISRLDYLKDWLSLQREKIHNGEKVDYKFDTYNTGDYTTLPTY